jgi:transcriptional regulator with PAS, ATPase and Fis domain
MVSGESFRQDLFYKINVVHLKLDPLRDRIEDIPLLMEYFLEGFNRITGKNIEGFSKSVFDACLKYDWPGNVRELKSFVERIVIFCKDQVVQTQHLPENIREPKAKSAVGAIKGLMTLKDLEKSKITETLSSFKGNKANTAKALGIGRNTLWRKLKEYEIEEEDYSK